MMIVWRIRGKIIRSVLCCIVYDSDVDTFLSSSYIVTVGLALDVLLVHFLSVLINAVLFLCSLLSL